MSELDIILGLVSVAIPVGAAGLGYGFRSARREGAMKQKVNDLEKSYAEHLRDYGLFQEKVSAKIEEVADQLAVVNTTVATTGNDVAWLKEFLTNGRSKKG